MQVLQITNTDTGEILISVEKPIITPDDMSLYYYNVSPSTQANCSMQILDGNSNGVLHTQSYVGPVVLPTPDNGDVTQEDVPSSPWWMFWKFW